MEARTCCEYHRLKDEGKGLAVISGFGNGSGNTDPDRCRNAVEWDGTIQVYEQPKPLRERLLALLKRIERQGVGDQCPYCRESLSIWVHAPDCELAALIRELS